MEEKERKKWRKFTGLRNTGRPQEGREPVHELNTSLVAGTAEGEVMRQTHSFRMLEALDRRQHHFKLGLPYWSECFLQLCFLQCLLHWNPLQSRQTSPQLFPSSVRASAGGFLTGCMMHKNPSQKLNSFQHFCISDFMPTHSNNSLKVSWNLHFSLHFKLMFKVARL